MISFSRVPQRPCFQNPTSPTVAGTYWFVGPEETLSKEKLPAWGHGASALSDGEALAQAERNSSSRDTHTVNQELGTQGHKSREDLCRWGAGPSLGNATSPVWEAGRGKSQQGRVGFQHEASCAKQKAISERSLGF